jgi:hypothetical protein
MKLKFLIAGFFSAVILGSVFTSCKSSVKMVDAAFQQKLHQAIENRVYLIEVNQMLPMMGRSQHLTSPYSLKVKNDSVFSYLPYFGRAYSVPYGGGQGLTFNSTIENYQSKRNAKGVYQISFKSQTREDTYVFNVEIYENGTTQIRVNSNNRQGITFLGEFNQQ